MRNKASTFISLLSGSGSTPPAEDEVTIGSQIWKNCNLGVTDGGSGIYSPNGDSGNVTNYGYLYTLSAATRIVATISGWRLPTLTELETLITNSNPNSGYHLRESGTTYWTSPNTGADNSLNFNGRGAGAYIGIYLGFKDSMFFWTSTEVDASNQSIGWLSYSSNLLVSSSYSKTRAVSIRLIKE